MKICFMTNNIYSIGGVQRVLCTIANQLSNYHEIHIFCTIDRGIKKEIYKINKDIKVIVDKDFYDKSLYSKILCKVGRVINNSTGIFNKEKWYKILKKIYCPEVTLQRLKNYINSNEYDVVIGVEGLNSMLLGAIADEINAKTIGWQHNCYDAYFNMKNKYYWNHDVILKKHISKLDRYLVLSNDDKEKYIKNDNINSQVMYNPKSFESKEKSKLNNKLFLAAGRFTEQKGFDLLIEAFNIFSMKDNSWNLVIVGSGEEEKMIQKRILKYGLEDRVNINRYTDDIKKYFLNASILLLPSRWEGLPMILLESLEMGVPIISYNISSVKQVIHNGIEGILVEPFNIDKFAEAMYRLANDEMLRVTMARGGEERIKDFNIDAIIGKWNEILNGFAFKE